MFPTAKQEKSPKTLFPPITEPGRQTLHSHIIEDRASKDGAVYVLYKLRVLYRQSVSVITITHI